MSETLNSTATFSWGNLRLLAATEQIDQPVSWRIHDASHKFIVHLAGYMDELETNLEGFGGSVGPATPGETWSIPAGCRYDSQARGASIRYAVLSLEPQALAGSEIAAVAGLLDRRLYSATEQLVVAASNSDDISQMHAASLAEEVEGQLAYRFAVENRPKAPQLHPRLTDKKVRFIRDFVFANLSERITLEMLARETEMTVHHLLVAFRKAFGTTPAQYLITQRLRRARWLLLSTRKGITEIALETGFTSHSHLTSAFTQRIGISPRDFRVAFS